MVLSAKVKVFLEEERMRRERRPGIAWGTFDSHRVCGRPDVGGPFLAFHKRMHAILRNALSTRGLSLHPTKCQLQTTRGDFQRGDIVIEEGFSIVVLPHGACLDLLGTKLSLQDPTGCEIAHRVAAGWSKFWALKRLLTKKHLSLNKRLRLFNSTVAGTILWGAESWTPRVEELGRLRATQNAMLRRIVCSGRGEGEDWVDWIQRATHQARRIARDAGVKDWVHEHFMRKWRWAGHDARMPVSKMGHCRDELAGFVLADSQPQMATAREAIQATVDEI